MIKRISAIFLLAFALAACGDSDEQILAAWITAVEQGDIEAAASITSTPSMVWERGVKLMSKQTILGRAMVNPGDVRPEYQRIQWHLADDPTADYLCVDVSVSDGKVKVWERLLYCNEAGVYGLSD